MRLNEDTVGKPMLTNFMILLYGVFPFLRSGVGVYAGRLLDKGYLLEGNLNTHFTRLLATRPLFENGRLLIPPFLVRFGGISRSKKRFQVSDSGHRTDILRLVLRYCVKRTNEVLGGNLSI